MITEKMSEVNTEHDTAVRPVTTAEGRLLSTLVTSADNCGAGLRETCSPQDYTHQDVIAT